MTFKMPRRTALGLAAGTLAAGTWRPARAQAKPVQMAVLAPLSGPWARPGMQLLSGVQMAADEINAAGGIKALGGAKMELVVVDAGDSAEKAKDAAQRMVAQYPDITAGTGAWLSTFTLAVTEVTERAEIPWLTLSYSDAITDRGFRFIFQTAPTANEQSVKALPTIMELAKRATGRDLKTVGVVADNTASSVSFLKPIRGGALDALKLKLVVDETYTPPLSDATSMVQRVRSAKPDFLLMITTNVPDTKLVLDKFNEFGLGSERLPKIASGGAMGAPEMVDVIGADILQGVMAIIANWGGKGEEELARRFTARTKEPWLNQDAILGYGDAMIVRAAVEAAGSADRRKVADAIRAMDLNDGPALLYPGHHLQFDAKGRRVGAQLVIMQWQSGKAVAVYPPDVATTEAIWPKS